MQLNDLLSARSVAALASVFVLLILPVAADGGRAAGALATH